MSYQRVRKQLFDAPRLLDPGSGGTIRVRYSPCVVMLVSAGAEARTLARPDKVGLQVRVGIKTAGGAITLTVTGGYDEDGATTFTLDNAGEFACFEAVDVGGTLQWRKTSDHATQVLTQTEIGWLQDVTAGTGAVSKALVLDSAGSLSFPAGTEGTTEVSLNGNSNGAPGAGISNGTGTVFKTSVVKVGGIITTNILIDITGLRSKNTDLDIIGVDNTGAAHMGQITAARNGTILGGIMRCLEVPTGGDPNIALYSANENTGVEDTLITDLGETLIFDPNADWTIDMARSITAMPPANDYLYLVQGDATGTDGTYTAGKFLITLYGYDA